MAGIARMRTIVLDCPDPQMLARFYGELLGWEVTDADDDWVNLAGPGGKRGINLYPAALLLTPTTACGVRHAINLPQVSGLDLTFGRGRAMLRSNRERNSSVQLTSSAPVGYTASLRCTLTSSVPTSRYGVFAAGRLACVR